MCGGVIIVNACTNTNASDQRIYAMIYSPFLLPVALAKKYQQVIRRYFVQYMNGFDHALLSEVIQVIICYAIHAMENC